MIEFHLHKILEEFNISQSRFAKLACVRPNTINDMCKGQTKRIEIHTLINILNTINQLSNRSISLNDLMVYKGATHDNNYTDRSFTINK
ncbi:helix-turn-helix domain-containing protein [Bacillus cereus group sp. MYBK71-2]|uniref:helix-turn-helix domain-containing protein n=1 Tax=unclassified Bacillus cereus group TaxID=2750818 RepID=UPI0022DEECBD|nr:helix-turn-helix transcriptional regulator [Bacillus cereus group sp. Bc010]MDA2771320.1 helix-turn-helix transcriptional regulator [Bacillus cereus group sp. Bc010]